jgi:hypothetical protein
MSGVAPPPTLSLSEEKPAPSPGASARAREPSRAPEPKDTFEAPTPETQRLRISIPDDEGEQSPTSLDDFRHTIPRLHPAWRPAENALSAKELLRGRVPGTWFIRPSLSLSRYDDGESRTYFFVLCYVDAAYDIKQVRLAWCRGQIFDVVEGPRPIPDISNAAVTLPLYGDNIHRPAPLDEDDINQISREMVADLSDTRIQIDDDHTVRNYDSGLNYSHRFPRLQKLILSAAHLVETGSIEPIDLSSIMGPGKEQVITGSMISAVRSFKKTWPRLKEIDLRGSGADANIVQRYFPGLRIVSAEAASANILQALMGWRAENRHSFAKFVTEHPRFIPEATAHTAKECIRSAGLFKNEVSNVYCLRSSRRQIENVDEDTFHFSICVRSPSDSISQDISCYYCRKACGFFFIDLRSQKPDGPFTTPEEIIMHHHIAAV